MNKKIDIENYLKNLFEFYKKSNYKFFVEKCLSYNVRIGDYNKDISFLSKNVYNLLLNKVIAEKDKVSYCETDSYFQLFISKRENFIHDMNIVVDIPVFENNYERIASIIFDTLYNNNLNFKMKFYKKLKNCYFKVIFDNVNDCRLFVDFYTSSSDISKEIMSRVIPFVEYCSLGIYTEFSPFSFKNFFIKSLYEYFNLVKENEISLEDFYKYNFSKFKVENDVNIKRMYKLMYQYINNIINDKSVFELFNSNYDMNISSFSNDEYILKLSDDKKIYFINSFDNSDIKYGTVDFLNICYSKYYNMFLKKCNNMEAYYRFFNIYDELFSNNYCNYKLIFNLIDEKMDLINKYLIIFSSAFFAYKEFSVSEREIFLFLDLVLDNFNIN